MLRTPASSTLTVSSLIGVSIADSACLLSADQFVQLGALLLQQRPHDPRAVCFLGGALSGIAGGRRNPAQNIVPLDGDLGDDPFLVLAGQQGAAALLAAEGPEGFRVRLFTDPDLVDRAALVLAQFGDLSYNLDALCDQEAQRGFVAAVVTALVAAPALRGVDLAALLGAERRWLDAARALAAPAGQSAPLALPAVRELLREAGVERAAVGLLDADGQQLSLLESGPELPRTLAPLPPPLASAARSQRATSIAPAEAASLAGPFEAWVGGKALTVLPLLRDGRSLGLLLAASERALPGAARAQLNGLATLLAGTLAAPPEPVPALPPPRPFPGLAANTTPAPIPALSPTPAQSPAPGGMQGLAARLSMTAPVGPPTQRPAVPPASASSVPASTPMLPAPPARPQAPSLAQRALAIGRGPSNASELNALLEHLSDGVVLVDGQGRLLSFTRTAAQLLGLQQDDRGRSLVESGAWALAPLLAEALATTPTGPREVELPGGRRANVDVLSLEGGMWACVLHTDATRPAVSEAAAAALLPTVDDGERGESFLTNFSNIIRVPLRELRELITQVPAAGNLNEQQSRLIGQVVRLNSEMTMLVNDLLALGQIRLQTAENLAPLRLDLLVEAAVGMQYAEFGRRGQHVVTEIAPGLPRVHGSEEGLGRAVAALIDNAIKYSPAGAQIRVAVSREGAMMRVAVQDNGPGLGPEELVQVFDPFFRAPSTESLGVSGRGLGLTIAKAVIEQHGGRIWAASAVGQGSAFSFTLPCV